MIFLATDPKSLGPAIELAFDTGFYQSADLSHPSAAQVPEVTIKGPGGIALTPKGALETFPVGVPRIVPGVGMLLEPASGNLLTGMDNARPVSTAGWTLLNQRPSGSTISLVDDYGSMYDATNAQGDTYIFRKLLAAGIMNGKAVQFYNPSGSTADFIVPIGSAAPNQRLSFSAYVRCLSGQAQFVVTGGGGSITFEGNYWQRAGRTHTPTASGGLLRIAVKPGARFNLILAQLEEARQITSPMVVNGQAVTRSADELTVDSTTLFGRQHAFVGEFFLPRQDGIHRQFFSLTNGRKEEIGALRHLDNALSSTLRRAYDDRGNRLSPYEDSYWIPRLPNILGPGSLVVGHRISPRGRTVGCAGLLAHDPFRVPPVGLSKMTIGVGMDGANPLNGWVRSIRIIGEVDDETLERLTTSSADAMAFDLARYISPQGDDAADGKTAATAWRTLSKLAWVDGVSPIPQGTHVFIQRGGAWNETLLPSNRVTFRGYGSGDMPKIGIGKTYALDENASNYFRLQGIHLTQATSRGVNSYGASGIQIVKCEISKCGSTADNNAIGTALRGNSRRTEAVIVSAPSTIEVLKYATSEAALTGVFVAKCITAGSDRDMKWSIFRPNGTQIAGTLTGGVEFNDRAQSPTFTLTLNGSANVGDIVKIRNKPFGEISFPGNGLAEDCLVMLNYIHDNVGKAAGDALYIEGIGGYNGVIGNRIPPPVGVAADCIQIGRNNKFYVANPAFAEVRANSVAAYTGGGKGAIVIISETTLCEANTVIGNNFCIGAIASGKIRWNYCLRADLYDYSWGIGPGGDFDVYGQEIYENTIVNCVRGVSTSGTGNTTFGLFGRVERFQNYFDMVIHDNIIINCKTYIYFDRPSTGQIYANDIIGDGTMFNLRPSTYPPPTGGRFKQLDVYGNNRGQ